jgi:hypothetical protein
LENSLGCDSRLHGRDRYTQHFINGLLLPFVRPHLRRVCPSGKQEAKQMKKVAEQFNPQEQTITAELNPTLLSSAQAGTPIP